MPQPPADEPVPPDPAAPPPADLPAEPPRLEKLEGRQESGRDAQDEAEEDEAS